MEISKKNKKIILARLSGIQASTHYHTSYFLHNLEEQLQREYNDILKIEEDYWKIRSRIAWLNDGDANTKNFHLSASNRKRKNQIIFFKDDHGNCLTKKPS